MNLVVTEGVAGCWHYHLSKPDDWTKALCGAQTMRTNIRLEDFGKSFGEHFPKHPTFCERCKSKAMTAFAAQEGET